MDKDNRELNTYKCNVDIRQQVKDKLIIRSKNVIDYEVIVC